MKSHEEVIAVDSESSRCRCNRCICCSHCYYRLSILLLSQLTSYQHEALKCHESQHFTWFARYKWCIWFTQTQAWIWFWNSKAFKRRGFRSIRFPRWTPSGLYSPSASRLRGRLYTSWTFPDSVPWQLLCAAEEPKAQPGGYRNTKQETAEEQLVTFMCCTSVGNGADLEQIESLNVTPGN